MLARLIQFSLSQRLFILLATLLVAGAGWYAFTQLPMLPSLRTSSTSSPSPSRPAPSFKLLARMASLS